MRSVRLRLAKETLTALATEDLAVVGGNAPDSLATCTSCVECMVNLERSSVCSAIVLTDCCRTIPTFNGAGGCS